MKSDISLISFPRFFPLSPTLGEDEGFMNFKFISQINYKLLNTASPGARWLLQGGIEKWFYWIKKGDDDDDAGSQSYNIGAIKCQSQ